jgi:two-component system response regulator AlgR
MPGPAPQQASQQASQQALPQASQQAAIAAVARERGPREQIAVHERGRLRLVPVAEIVYLKAEQKYVTVRTAAREYLIEESLVALEDELAGSFVRVHRNALVARKAITAFERVDAPGPADSAADAHWEVQLDGIAEKLPVSRRQWPVVKALVKALVKAPSK